MANNETSVKAVQIQVGRENQKVCKESILRSLAYWIIRRVGFCVKLNSMFVAQQKAAILQFQARERAMILHHVTPVE